MRKFENMSEEEILIAIDQTRTAIEGCKGYLFFLAMGQGL